MNMVNKAAITIIITAIAIATVIAIAKPMMSLTSIPTISIDQKLSLERIKSTYYQAIAERLTIENRITQITNQLVAKKVELEKFCGEGNELIGFETDPTCKIKDNVTKGDK